jgi:hypothetical protein
MSNELEKLIQRHIEAVLVNPRVKLTPSEFYAKLDPAGYMTIDRVPEVVAHDYPKEIIDLYNEHHKLCVKNFVDFHNKCVLYRERQKKESNVLDFMEVYKKKIATK